MNEFVAKENNFLKKRENGLLLTDYQIEILVKHDINYLYYSDYKTLLFEIDTVLEDVYDEELENISNEISELYYYNYTNK